ncbi:putative membrane protein [Photobacterium aphoticum]|uniref:Putative membrane protein n=1 Tax=Photobacterium aphoticum TaxID=754436 RepID=A0A090QM55_9GAMM|nr:putative membrane protein [Photobacterium aphoticum]
MHLDLTFLFDDAVTAAIILLTVIFFVFFFIREFWSTYQEKKRLDEILRIKEESKDNTVDAQKLSKNQFVWLTDHLLFNRTQDTFHIEAKDGQWLTKSPITQMIPMFDASRYKMVPALLTSIGITGTF